MTEFAAIAAAPLGAETDRPVDLAHLARQTMGNADLELEVLRLFVRQSETVMARLRTEPGVDRAMLAHVLLGSARGIGARKVAVVAERVETLARVDPNAGTHEIDELGTAVEEANRFIRSVVAG